MLIYFTVHVLDKPFEMGRESSLGIKELFNIPPLVLKAEKLLSGSAFCTKIIAGVPEQVVGGSPKF